jgi:hypothetical protein
MSDPDDPIAQYQANLEKTLAAFRAGLEASRTRERRALADPPSKSRGGRLRSARAQIRWYERHIDEWEKGRI